MAEYEGREQAYGATMGGQLKAFLENVAIGDHHLQDLAMERAEIIFDAPNFDLNATMSLLGIDPGLKFSANLPRIMAENLAPLLIEEAEVEGHMDVHASTSEEDHKKVDTSADVEAKVGWGPVSAKVKIHAQAAVESDRKRESDYSAGIKWRVLLKKQAPPETLNRIVDALVRFFNKVTDINETLADAKADELKAQALPAGDDSGDDSDADADSSDDSGNDDSGDNGGFNQ